MNNVLRSAGQPIYYNWFNQGKVGTDLSTSSKSSWVRFADRKTLTPVSTATKANSGLLASMSVNSNQEKPNLIRRYIIVGERRLSNYWWTTVVFLGACGFLYTGISSFLGQSLVEILFGFTNNNLQKNTLEQVTQVIPFFPQGLLMSFYGSLGLLLSVYWSLLIFWNVGGGFNEFNKKDGFIRIFRWGYPGKNRKIDFIYNLKDVEAIRVELKQGLDPQRTIYLKLKSNNPVSTLNNKTFNGVNKLDNAVQSKPQPTLNKIKREIPLTGISQPLTLKEIEKQASELANFLQVSLEGL